MITILNSKGHEVITEDVQSVAMKLFQEGYTFWTNVGAGGGVELGERVKVGSVTEDANLVALKPLAGG